MNVLHIECIQLSTNLVIMTLAVVLESRLSASSVFVASLLMASLLSASDVLGAFIYYRILLRTSTVTMNVCNHTMYPIYVFNVRLRYRKLQYSRRWPTMSRPKRPPISSSCKINGVLSDIDDVLLSMFT